jgi:hypothetical protein
MIACSDFSQLNKVKHNAGQYKGGDSDVCTENLIRRGAVSADT